MVGLLVNNELEMIQKETVGVSLTLSSDVCLETNGHQDKPETELSVSLPRFKPSTFQILALLLHKLIGMRITITTY
jgi:hypothetical protein